MLRCVEYYLMNSATSPIKIINFMYWTATKEGDLYRANTWVHTMEQFFGMMAFVKAVELGKDKKLSRLYLVNYFRGANHYIRSNKPL